MRRWDRTAALSRDSAADWTDPVDRPTHRRTCSSRTRRRNRSRGRSGRATQRGGHDGARAARVRGERSSRSSRGTRPRAWVRRGCPTCASRVGRAREPQRSRGRSSGCGARRCSVSGASRRRWPDRSPSRTVAMKRQNRGASKLLPATRAPRPSIGTSITLKPASRQASAKSADDTALASSSTTQSPGWTSSSARCDWMPEMRGRSSENRHV